MPVFLRLPSFFVFGVRFPSTPVWPSACLRRLFERRSRGTRALRSPDGVLLTTGCGSRTLGADALMLWSCMFLLTYTLG